MDARVRAAILPAALLDFGPALSRAGDHGFDAVEVVALVERPPEHYEALADSGLFVACAALGSGLPQGYSLDAPAVEAGRAALELLKRQLADAATLGATRAYLRAGAGAAAAGLAQFAEGCALLAAYAARRMVRLCVKPPPGRALAWLETSRPDVGLVLDVAACLASGENPATVVRRAGRRLGHVYLDGEASVELLAVLVEVGYEGALAVPLPAGAEEA